MVWWCGGDGDGGSVQREIYRVIGRDGKWRSIDFELVVSSVQNGNSSG